MTDERQGERVYEQVMRLLVADARELRQITLQVMEQIRVMDLVPQDVMEKMTVEDMTSFVRDHIQEIPVVVNHSRVLLKRAAQFAEEGEFQDALLYLATLFEHSLNGIIIGTCRNRRMREKVGFQVVRSASLEAKATWVLELLGLPPMDEQHVKTVKRVAEQRNRYVHYKYPEIRDDAMPEHHERRRVLYLEGCSAAAYLREYKAANVNAAWGAHLSELLVDASESKSAGLDDP